MIRLGLIVFILGSTASAALVPDCAAVFFKQAGNADFLATGAAAVSGGALGPAALAIGLDLNAKRTLGIGAFEFEPYTAGVVAASTIATTASLTSAFYFRRQENFLRLLGKARAEMETSDKGFHTFLLTAYLNSILDGGGRFENTMTGSLPETIQRNSSSTAGDRFEPAEVTRLFRGLERVGELCPNKITGIRPRELMKRLVWTRANHL